MEPKGDEHMAAVPSPLSARPSIGNPDIETMEWVWHLDLHLTEHDLVHAGKALRSAWPELIRIEEALGGGERETATEIADAVINTLLALQTQLERANGEGYILAMAVLQSDLDLDDTEEAARDYFLPKSLKG